VNKIEYYSHVAAKVPAICIIIRRIVNKYSLGEFDVMIDFMVSTKNTVNNRNVLFVNSIGGLAVPPNIERVLT